MAGCGDEEEARAEAHGSREKAAANAVSGWGLVPWIAGEEGGTRGVAVKCIDITKNPDCVGRVPAR